MRESRVSSNRKHMGKRTPKGSSGPHAPQGREIPRSAPADPSDEVFRVAADRTPPRLAEGEVHVWSASLDLEPDPMEGLRRLLNSEETAKASRFHFARDRDAFTAARGILRSLLGGYLDRAPERIHFLYGPQGKPALPAQLGAGPMQFNISHSGDIALFAFARVLEVGVDVERIRAQPDLEQVAERFFSEQEVAALRSMPRPLRDRAFFTCWTRKEAYIKGRGGGLSIPLNEFSVSLAPGEPAMLSSSSGEPGEPSRWSLRDLPLGAEYAGALAVRGPDWRLARWSWSP